MSRIAISGAGAFGAALACAFASHGHRVTLWGRDAGTMDAARASRLLPRLPGVTLPGDLTLTSDPAALEGADARLVCVPTQSLRAHLRALPEPDAPVVLCCKGMEVGTGLLPSEVARDVLPDARIGVLTGPGFAGEIAALKPTALTVAGMDGLDRALQDSLATASIRLYRTDDVTGAQIGGAMKNVIAIACGVTIGAGLGESARAAVLTRGYAEMTRFALARGGRAETLSGLSGLGDLALTATSTLSRNFAFGVALGSGQPPAAGKTVEGAATAGAFAALSGRLGIDLPIAAMVAALVAGDLPVADAIVALLSRPLKPEA